MMPWPLLTMQGSGSLGLPYALSQLGWYIGLSVCVLFGLFALYSGLLLGKFRNDSFPDVCACVTLLH